MSKPIVWIEITKSVCGFQACIVTKFGGVCGAANGATREQAIELVSKNLRKPIPPVVDRMYPIEPISPIKG